MLFRQPSDGAHHGRRSAHIQLDLFPVAQRREGITERSGDEAFRSAAAVFGCQDDPDAEALEEVHFIELGRAPGAVEERRGRASRVQRFRKRQKRREPHAPGNHPRLRRRIDGLERLPEGSQTGDARARFDFVQQPRADPDALVQKRDANRCAIPIAKDLEYREWPPQEGVHTPRRLDHDELTRLRERRDLRRFERDDAVVV